MSCMPRGNKGFGNLLNVNYVRKKIGSPRENCISFSLVTKKSCYLPGKLRKYICCNLFWLHERRNSRHFFKLGAWRATNPRVCSSRFSALRAGFASEWFLAYFRKEIRERQILSPTRRWCSWLASERKIPPAAQAWMSCVGSLIGGKVRQWSKEQHVTQRHSRTDSRLLILLFSCLLKLP